LKKRESTTLKTTNVFREFMEDTDSFELQYSNPKDTKILYRQKHDSVINKSLGVDSDIQLFTIIGLEVFLSKAIINPNLKQVRFFVAFTQILLPEKVHSIYFNWRSKFIWFPKNIEIFDRIAYDDELNEFYFSGKRIDVNKFFQKNFIAHIRPVRPIAGFFIRQLRRLRYFLLNPFLKILTNSFYLAHKFITGDSFSIHHKAKDFSIFFHTTDKINIQTIEIDDFKRVEFFKYRLNIQPIIAFAVIHLILYTTLYLFRSIPNYYLDIIDKPVLTIIYGIGSFSIMYWLIGGILKFFTIILFKSYRKTLGPRERGYVF